MCASVATLYYGRRYAKLWPTLRHTMANATPYYGRYYAVLWPMLQEGITPCIVPLYSMRIKRSG